MEKPNLFVDLDGVLFDFVGYYQTLFGKHIDDDNVSDKELWKNINSYPNFFAELPPMNNAQLFFELIKNYNPIILTACSASNYESCAKQKRENFFKTFDPGQKFMFLPMMHGKYKYIFKQHHHDFLLDDHETNILNWFGDDARAQGYLHTDDFEESYEAIKKWSTLRS